MKLPNNLDYEQSLCWSAIKAIHLLIETNNNNGRDALGDPIGRFYNEETIDKFKKAIGIIQDQLVATTLIVDLTIDKTIDEQQFNDMWAKAFQHHKE
jgi:hypothetical protein